jgi:hypothetical protein
MHAAGEARKVIPVRKLAVPASTVPGTPGVGVPSPLAPDLAQLGHRVLVQ